MSKQLIPAQRREQIQEYLSQHKVASSSDLSMLLGVSEATVRRDLEWLENAGILSRTHGGAILTQQLQVEPAYAKRTQHQVNEKRAIGRLAASLIQDGDIVFTNSGTTTTQLIQHINPGLDISLITNNLAAVMEIGEIDYELILLGGDGWNDPSLDEQLIGRLAGAYYTRHFDPGDDEPRVAAFVAAYQQRHGGVPTDAAALGYDAMRAVLTIYDPRLDGGQLHARLLGLRDLPGVTGDLNIGPLGSALRKPIVLVRAGAGPAGAFVARLGG